MSDDAAGGGSSPPRESPSLHSLLDAARERSSVSQRTLQRARGAAVAAGVAAPPLLPSFTATDASWQQVSADGSRYEPAVTTYRPPTSPLPRETRASCSLCGADVKSGLRMCHHWRAMHPQELSTQGYAVRGGFACIADALSWLDAFIAPLGCRLSKRGGSLTRTARGISLTLRCACVMFGDREIEAARASLARVSSAKSQRVASSARGAAVTAFTTDVAASLLEARTLGGTGALLTTRTVTCCHASGRISDGGTGVFCAEYFHLHSHPMAVHHALSPHRREIGDTVRELVAAGSSTADVYAAVCDAAAAAAKPPPSIGAVGAAIARARYPLRVTLPSSLPCQLVLLKIFEDCPALAADAIIGLKLAGAPATLQDVGKPGGKLHLGRDDWFISLALRRTLTRISSQMPHTVLIDTKHQVVAQLRDHGAIVIAYGHRDGHTDMASVTLVSSKDTRLMTAAAHVTETSRKKAAATAGVGYSSPTNLMLDMAAGEADAVRAAIPSIERSYMCAWHVLHGFGEELKGCCIADPALVAVSRFVKRQRSDSPGAATERLSARVGSASDDDDDDRATTSATHAHLVQQQRKSLAAALAALVTVADPDVFSVLCLGIISRHHGDDAVMKLLCREPYNRLGEIAAANRALLDGLPATNDGVEAHNRVIDHGGERMVHVGGAVIRLLHDLVFNEHRAAARLATAALKRAREADLAAMTPLPPPAAAEIARRKAAAARAVIAKEERRTSARDGHAAPTARGSASRARDLAPGADAAAVEARGAPVAVHPPLREAACVADLRRALGSHLPRVTSLATLADAGASELVRPQPAGRGVRAAVFAAVAPSTKGTAARLAAFCAAKLGDDCSRVAGSAAIVGSSSASASVAATPPTFTSIVAAWREGFRVAVPAAATEAYDAAVAAAVVGVAPVAASVAAASVASRSEGASGDSAELASSTLLELASVGGAPASSSASASGSSSSGAAALSPLPSVPPLPSFASLPSFAPYVAKRGAHSADFALVHSCVYAESEREYPSSLAAEMRRLGSLPTVQRVAVPGTAFGFRPVDLSNQAPAGRPPVRVLRADKAAAAASLIAAEALGGASDAARQAYKPHVAKKRARGK